MTKKEHFEKFDKDFEELEASPYNASEEYFNAGWKCGTEEAVKLLSELLEKYVAIGNSGIDVDIINDMEKLLNEF